MDKGFRESLGDPKRKILAVLVFTAFLIPVFSTTIIITHNSPLNAVVSGEEGDAWNNSAGKLIEAGKYPGLHFGDFKPVRKQVLTIPGLLILTWPLASWSLLFAVIVLGIPWFISQIVDWAKIWKAVLGVIWVFLIFPSFELTLFEFVHELYYITSDGWNDINIWQATLGRKMHTFFLVLLIGHSVTINLIPLLWTRTIIPDFFTDDEISTNKKLVHIENWRQYGTWMTTLFGGIALSAIFVLITENQGYGGAFIRHFLILLGGVVVLGLMFIVLKVYRLERELIKEETGP